jgi:hypothetical protein
MRGQSIVINVAIAVVIFKSEIIKIKKQEVDRIKVYQGLEAIKRVFSR